VDKIKRVLLISDSYEVRVMDYRKILGRTYDSVLCEGCAPLRIADEVARRLAGRKSLVSI